MSSVSGNFSGRFLPVLLIVIAMVSVQSGASLAKMLFPLVGAEGATSLRLMVGATALMLFFPSVAFSLECWQSGAALSLWCGIRGNELLFYRSILTLPLGCGGGV